MCEVFHVLPYMGGLFDQPGVVLLRMEKIKLAENAVDEAEAAKAKAKEDAENRVEKRLSGT